MVLALNKALPRHQLYMLIQVNRYSPPVPVHQILPVLKWDPGQQLIVLTDHPPIPHVARNRLISMSSISVLSCEVCYDVDSDWIFSVNVYNIQ